MAALLSGFWAGRARWPRGAPNRAERLSRLVYNGAMTSEAEARAAPPGDPRGDPGADPRYPYLQALNEEQRRAVLAVDGPVLVLAGALAAGNRARAHDAVVLKTLGATRRTLIRAFSYEYLILGLATAVFALFAGGIAAWFVVSRIMTLPSQFLPDVAVLTVIAALILTVGIGLAGTWRVLGQKAAPILRNL